MPPRVLAIALLLAACSGAGCGGRREAARAPEAAGADEAISGEVPLEHEAEAAASVAGGFDVEHTLASAAYTVEGAPSVVVHAPPSFDPAAPLHLVVFLHGWSGCARVLAGEGAVACREGARAEEGWGLAAELDATGVPALFVIPQLAFLAHDGSPGRFGTANMFAAFIEELLVALAPQVGARRPADLAGITLLAHSAGFETALAILDRGGLEIRNVVLFDALYRGVEPFLAWAEGDPRRRLASLHTAQARTAEQSGRLAARARQALGIEAVAHDAAGSLATLLLAHRVVVARTRAPHGLVPRRHLADVVPTLDARLREVHSAP